MGKSNKKERTDHDKNIKAYGRKTRRENKFVDMEDIEKGKKK